MKKPDKGVVEIELANGEKYEVRGAAWAVEPSGSLSVFTIQSSDSQRGPIGTKHMVVSYGRDVWKNIRFKRELVEQVSKFE